MVIIGIAANNLLFDADGHECTNKFRQSKRLTQFVARFGLAAALALSLLLNFLRA